MLKQTLKIGLFGASLLLLAACSTTGNNGASGSDQDGSGSGANGGASSSAVGDMTSFNGGAGGSSMRVENQSYYFDFDQSSIHDADNASIKVQADYLNSHPKAKVLLTGNTDERGSREYNIGLGQRRADALASVLEADGVSKNQITTVSYGDEKPAALGHDESAWAKNRRADLIYQTPISK